MRVFLAVHWIISYINTALTRPTVSPSSANMSGFADPINDVEVNQEEEQQEEVESTRPAILRQGFPVPAE